MRKSPVLACVLVAAAVLGIVGTFRTPLAAQSLYSIHSPPIVAAPAIVTEFTGPPAPPCGYPNGPVLGVFPTFAAFPCALPGSFAPPPVGLLGDIAFNKVADLVYATDGLLIGVYTPAGAPLASFAPPALLGPLTGMGFNSAAGILWITDGALIMGIFPPPPGCGGVLGLAFPPFPAPAPGLVTDLDWDPSTGTLWCCHAVGAISNIFPGGAPGPFGTFPLAVAACGLAPPLTGLAYDSATPNILGAPPAFYVTNGTIIAYLTPPGGPAALTFYTTANCFPAPTPMPIQGLAASAHGISYGTGNNPFGLPVPTIATTGNSTTPGAMTIILGGAAPGGAAYLFLDAAALCPPLPFKGNPLYALPTFTFGPFPVPIIGGITIPLAIPPAVPAGLSGYFQWVIKTVPGFEVSPGLEMTVNLP